MNIVRVTKEFTFEMAHALDCHDGKCKNIHGHSYHLSVCVKGTPINDNTSPKNGMILDFADLKAIVKKEITDKYDHALVLWENSPFNTREVRENSDKLILEKNQPTCENLIIDFAVNIQNNLPDYITLVSIKLRETATSFAEWFAAENLD